MDFNGIDSTPIYHPPKHVGRYYCNRNDRYVLSVGRLDPKKRVDLLIESLVHCDRSIKVVIAGTGPEMKNLQKLSELNHLGDRVKFLGYVQDDELIELYANAGAVYFAPVDEDYGYITLEAFLSRKPIVTCTDSGAVLEFARHGQNAMVSAPSPEAIGISLDRLVQDPRISSEFGESGYRSVKDIGWDNVIDSLTKTIR
jgi:glycosyltransferase involved in cell wall biosynthesis